ncbi:Mitochondrial assembly of ribosomal large subunit protein 1 [Pseudolycoriella hygida]|uniref:Mitochondrial assembly of ribosomal large subunit protein 1 n=1 Tax=Pseudolycoriella hygida TaxID=35572 RepID=A0A9Q0MI16_9DIPT|nr:Mitochondrial assembly of ribosomal large subunit protein 1 [Pseudolycoriella hygida]
MTCQQFDSTDHMVTSFQPKNCKVSSRGNILLFTSDSCALYNPENQKDNKNVMFSVRNLARLSYLRTKRLCMARHLHDDHKMDPSKIVTNPKDKVPTTSPAVASKFNVYTDDTVSVILDVDEERQRIAEEITETDEILDYKAYAGLNLERGVSGVFDIEDLVEVLRRENAEDIFVCTVPAHLKYVDYMCVVTGRSLRHRIALAQFVRKLFKIKRHKGEILPRIEGEKSKIWMAMDLGNISLHIFSADARALYDVESLWSVGWEFDKEYNESKELGIEKIKNSAIFLGDLMPNERI